jgi:hypothetical protein
LSLPRKRRSAFDVVRLPDWLQPGDLLAISAASVWPATRLPPFFGGADVFFSRAMLLRKASARFTTFCCRTEERSRGAEDASLLILEHFDHNFNSGTRDYELPPSR